MGGANSNLPSRERRRAMNVDEAMARQWLRDNRGNLAWSILRLQSEQGLASTLSCRASDVKHLIATEYAGYEASNLYDLFKSRTEDYTLDDLGLERCHYCGEMIANPIESAKAGGHLCRGCMRWYEQYEYRNPELTLEWQVWSGRSALALKLTDRLDQLARNRKQINVESED